MMDTIDYSQSDFVIWTILTQIGAGQKFSITTTDKGLTVSIGGKVYHIRPQESSKGEIYLNIYEL